ncbi:citrate lyase beta subunit [Frankia casuarinae]|uniref:Citrate lyase n=1 Tax=Frankia casuarinae (strain DSM 45818 / CECT 9043 / HFP020203 / CcI3) TaxID=106370 RepID=Q2J980_FRACC|nr:MULTISPECIES: CoA ester lyase [Frankia]ABD12162.1 Citrate lyase [Frankia casuarinae]ETA02460.1 citrate lyase beta subunit [Frankia sp. CcI6]EYT92088.1 citrate lyase beta subunit [Frankia casuarinae]KEZ36007.1 citrate lyase beta subunit [Frankia sp. CeD]KFB04877.1 citrate lyase beta subunit [Frankia sp. Allo2]
MTGTAAAGSPGSPSAGRPPAAYRPRRSVLYMPGANERAMEKARNLPADALILDLEDAVAPVAKERAREQVCAAVADAAYGHREVTVRVNARGSSWHADDLRAAGRVGPDAVVVPKVESPSDVHAIEKGLEAAGAPDRTMIWAMVETPGAILRAQEIAQASPRLTVLVMGTNDLANELRAEFVPGRAPLLTGLGLCLLAARASGTVILDGVYNDIRDADGFAAECRQGREMGFDGKTLIHPNQIETCNRTFSPTEAQVAQAAEIVRVWEEALREGRGVATVDGRLIENLHVDNARRILAVSAAIAGLADGQAAS